MSEVEATLPTPPLRVLVVDDEALARLRLRSLVEACPVPAAEVVGEAATAGQALAWLATHDADLLLLDIAMPGRGGMQLAGVLREQCGRDLRPPPLVVFVTAHAGHALEAFDVDAVDYLTKPVRRERLQAALQRCAQRLHRQAAAPPASEGGPTVVVSDAGRLLRVPVADILVLKAELKYVTARCAARSHVLDDSLSELEQRFPHRFLRVHRNALVARDAVRAFERRSGAGDADDDGGPGWAVQVAGIDEWIAVSRRHAAAVREALAAR